MPVRSTVLLGADHTELGEVAVMDFESAGALAISRGKFRKGYPYVDPNEDAAFIATDGTAWMLGVADGHNGFDAAKAAVGALESTAKRTFADAATNPEVALADAITAAHAAVVGAVGDPGNPRADSATTLAVTLITGGNLTVVSLGDSIVALVRDQRLLPLNRPSPFLDVATDPTSAQMSGASLQPGDVVLVATDGLTDFLGRRGRRALGQTLGRKDSPDRLAGAAIELAFAGGAGDNVAMSLFAPSLVDA